MNEELEKMMLERNILEENKENLENRLRLMEMKFS